MMKSGFLDSGGRGEKKKKKKGNVSFVSILDSGTSKTVFESIFPSLSELASKVHNNDDKSLRDDGKPLEPERKPSLTK
jgi:hypothetical protein